MPAILTNAFSAVNAQLFVHNYTENASSSGTSASTSSASPDSTLFIGVGRGYVDGVTTSAELGSLTVDQYKRWTTKDSNNNEIAIENNPPTPQDTLAQEDNFRSNLIMIKSVDPSNIMLMVPRVNWESSDNFAPLNSTQLQGRRARNYYCLNSENEVWLCTKKGSRASTVEPKLARNDSSSTSSSALKRNGIIDSTTSTDGYGWEFLYNIETSIINKGMLLDDWMPVPYGFHHGFYSKNNGYITDEQGTYGQRDAARILGAYRVLVSVTLEDEGDALPYNSIYRQVGLIADPCDSSKNLISSGTYSNTQFDTQSGDLVYLENRKPVLRSTGQSETLSLLLVF